MSRTQAPFSFKDISFANMNDIAIGVSVKDRSCGRRFTLTYDNSTSDPIVFNDIFKKIQKTVKDEGNVENLLQAKTFLKTLKNAEKAAITDYESMGTGFKILTAICRFFSFGSHAHLDDIKELKTSIQAQLHALDFDKNITDAQNKATRWKHEEDFLLETGEMYINTNNLHLADRVTTVMGSCHQQMLLLVKLSNAFIARNELNSALDMAKRISLDNWSENQDLCIRIAQLYLEKDDLENVVLAATGIKVKGPEQNLILFTAAKAFDEKGDLVNARNAAALINRSFGLDQETTALLKKLGIGR